MFEAVLREVAVLRNLLYAIEDLLNDVDFECSEQGMDAKSMTTDGFSLVCFYLKSGSFDRFFCRKKFMIRLIMTDLCAMFRSAGTKDALVLRVTDDENMMIVFQPHGGKKCSWYKRPILGEDAVPLDIPPTPGTCIVKMSSREFLRICRDLCTLGKSIEIESTRTVVKFSSAGKYQRVVFELFATMGELNSEQEVIIISQCPVKIMFSRTYIFILLKAVPLCASVKIYMVNDGPLVCEYMIGNLGAMRFYFATKTEIDEEVPGTSQPMDV